jgi:hypothetical protein
MRCPSCGSDVNIILSGRCIECADGETRAWLEALQPDE